jgi:hypothetical protein
MIEPVRAIILSVDNNIMNDDLNLATNCRPS